MSMSITDAGQRVVMLAGAGASVHLGLPTLDDLLQRAVLGNDDVADLIRDTRDSIESESTRYRKAVFEELIVKIRDYLRIAYSLRTDPTLRKVLPGLPSHVETGTSEGRLKRALTRCYRVLLDEYGPNKVNPQRDEFAETLKLFDELAQLNEGTLHVFTTNYDCSYQVLASSCQRQKFLSHIDNRTGRFRDEWYLTRPELESQTGSSIYIHRLHGCVGWFNTCVGLDVMDMGMSCGSIEEIFGSGARLDIVDDDYLHNMCIKLITAQLVGTNPVFSTAFEELSQYLRRAHTLFVWGYSFRDLEVMRYIDHAMAARREPLQVIYLDPYLTEEKAVFNIRKTLHETPSSMYGQLRPIRLEWRPLDGFKELLRIVVERLKKEG